MVGNPSAVRESYEVPDCCPIVGLDVKVQHALSKKINDGSVDKEIPSALDGLAKAR